ncbi:hypothetical protein ACF0H5_024538 [Mactra antiquata]
MDKLFWGMPVLFVWTVALVHSGTAVKVCWTSAWYNDSSPTPANRSDYEHQTASVLNSLCTSGSVIDARCKDEKGEAFTSFKNDSSNMYVATCNVVTGLICHPYNTTKQTCPDFAIQYGCQCPTPTTTTNVMSLSSSFGMPSQHHGSGLRGVTTKTGSPLNPVGTTSGPMVTSTQGAHGLGPNVSPTSRSSPSNSRNHGPDSGANKMTSFVFCIFVCVILALSQVRQ